MPKSIRGGNLFAIALVASSWAAIAPAAAQDAFADADLLLNRKKDPGTAIAQTNEPIQIIEIQLDRTDTGVEILFVTESGTLSAPVTAIDGNTLTAEIPNAVLDLAGEATFEAIDPVAGIAAIEAVTIADATVLVTVIGTEAPPTAETIIDDRGLRFSVSTPEVIDLVVVGEQIGSDDYDPDASTATRTDTPLDEIPQSIQIIPQEILEDQQVIELDDALRNVSGVVAGSNDSRGQRYTIRGFDSASVLRDGFRLTFGFSGNIGSPELSHIESVEVLKGPAAILFGAVEPGGVINLVSEQPLSEPFYELGLRVGNHELIEPSIDLSGPLTNDGRVLYRLNALYRHEESFRDYDTEIERFFVAPIVSIELGDRTDLVLDFEYRDDTRPGDFGLVAIGDEVADIPFDRALGEPDDITETEFLRTGYQLEHQLSDAWKLRNAFHYTSYDTEFITAIFRFAPVDEETGTIGRSYILLDQPSDTFELQTNIVGEFSTGAIEHTLLAGVDLYRRETFGNEGRGDLRNSTPFNIFDPVYGELERPDFDESPIFFSADSRIDTLGVYLQDQVSLSHNLHLLAGIRYETADQETENNPSSFNPEGSESEQEDDAFVPRVGLVYQPVEEVSLFASYSQSFYPNSGMTVDGDLLDPERGEQFEIGARAELLGDRLLASLAYFNVTKENVATPDPDVPNFSIATGEQNSQGLEFDLIGEIAPGWNIVANYAITDAEITEDNSDIEGNDLFGVPEHNANLWTTYEIQSGSLQGLSFGIGFNYVSDRFGDNDNSFELDDYFLTNLAVAYARNNWEARLNIRNLFDVDYIQGTENSRSDSIYPGEDFTILGSFTVQF